MLTFEELLAARGQALTRLAFLLTQNPHDAQDVVQTALTRAFAQWPRVAASDRPEAYVRRILVNAYLDDRASRRERPAPPDDVLLDRAVDDDPGDRLATHVRMWAVLATLPRQQRAVLVLRYYESLTDDEIAQVLDCAPGTVRTHAARGLAALRATCPRDADDDASTHPGGRP